MRASTAPKWFVPGKIYSREQVHGLVGGSLQSFLPVVKGRVVAGCFWPELNPDAPEVVLPLPGPAVERAIACARGQDEPFPVLLRRQVGSWSYVGLYRALPRLPSTEELACFTRRSRRSDVWDALFLERVGE